MSNYGSWGYKNTEWTDKYTQVKCKCILPLNPFYLNEIAHYIIGHKHAASDEIVLVKYRTDGGPNLYYISKNEFKKHFIDIEDNREQLLTDLGLL